MYSFYGGQEGRTYHIVKSYPSIAAMNADFNSDNTQVMYHQYVLIDTTGPSISIDGTTYTGEGINNPDNGKLYRRGFSEAEYVGNIRGATGNTADIVFNNNLQFTTNKKTYEPEFHAAGETGNGNKINSTYQIFESAIGQPTTFGMKLSIPYPNITASASTVAYNATASANVTTTAPYRYKVNLNIPNGVPGTSFSETARIVNPGSSNQKLSFNVTTYSNTTSGTGTIQVPFPTISSISLDSNNNWIAYYKGTDGTNYSSSQPIGAGVYTRAVVSGSGEGYKNLPSSATVGTTYSKTYVDHQNWGWPDPSDYSILVKKNESQDQYILVPIESGSGWRVAQDLQGETEPRAVVELKNSPTIATNSILKDYGLHFTQSNITITPFG